MRTYCFSTKKSDAAVILPEEEEPVEVKGLHGGHVAAENLGL